jgi:hypothetical protein
VTNKSTLLQSLDKFILAHVQGKLPCDFTLHDVTGITGEVLPGVWLYNAIVKDHRYVNVYHAGVGARGNIYTIGHNARIASNGGIHNGNLVL